MGAARIPIFVLSFNRGAQLRAVIGSYRLQRAAIDVVVHDNGSDDAHTLQVLRELETEGVRVRRGPKIHVPAQLEGVEASVADYFGPGRARTRYVVTDCDIDLGVADPRALEVYDELLDRVPAAQCVGPMLRIRDIPRDYPLYNRVMNRHIEQFWRHRPHRLQTAFGTCAVLPAAIDTSFALHRAEFAFRRMRLGLRTYAPFEALHLDWYPQRTAAGYRESSSGAISHWDNARQLRAHAREALRFEGFHAIDVEPDGNLRDCWVALR